jgi:hypothetical protein
MNFLAEWKNVERNGLPEPDSNKIYFVVHYSGCGYGTYDYDVEWIEKEISDEWGIKYDLVKTEKKRWRLDFDGVGHEDEITDYFEIIYPKDCKREYMV